MTDLAVVTFLWSDQNHRWADSFNYGVEHVEKLARAVRRHLTVPHEFVLITDYPPELFSEPDRVIPLWDDYRDMGGCYVRLKTFDESVGSSIAKRFMWLDLDIVITGNIDHLVQHNADFWSWEDPNPPMLYCGSLIGMKAGARKQVWERFNGKESAELARRFVGTDQAWINHVLKKGEKRFGMEDGIYSYKKYVRKKGLPEDACMVVFHGEVDPSVQKDDWIKDHWI